MTSRSPNYFYHHNHAARSELTNISQRISGSDARRVFLGLTEMATQGCRDVPWDVWATMLAHADVETVARCAAASPFWFDLAGQALLLRAQQHLRGLSPDPRSPPLHLFERPSAVAADTHMPRLSLVKCLCLAELRRRGRPGCIATCGLTNAYADILGGLWMWGDVYDQRLRGHILGGHNGRCIRCVCGS